MPIEREESDSEQDAFAIADKLFKDRNFEEAIQYYDKGLDKDPADAMGWYKLGYCYYKLEQFDEALRCLENAIGSNKNFAKAYNIISLIYYSSKQKRYIDAEINALKAVTLSPNEVDLWINYGLMLDVNGKKALALACFEIGGLKINPNDPDAEKLKEKINRRSEELTSQGKYPFEECSFPPGLIKQYYPFPKPTLPSTTYAQQASNAEESSLSLITSRLRSLFFRSSTQEDRQPNTNVMPSKR